MEVYNQFVDPTTCTQALECAFTSKKAHNLVVSKGTLLQLFSIEETAFDDASASSNTAVASMAAKESFLDEDMLALTDKSYKLVLLAEYKLQGRIVNIDKFRSNEQPDVDYLIVCTEFVKLSIARWDSSSHIIRTSSLHFYEPALQAVLIDDLSKVQKTHRTDPNSGCTSIETEGLFIFLPFYKVDEDEDDPMDELNDDNDDAPRRKSKKKRVKTTKEAQLTPDTANVKYFDPSFILPAEKLRPDLKNILDYQYLHSYRNPVIAVLYAPETISWAGHLPKAKDNMKVVVLSLDLHKKSARSIMELNNLPYDIDFIYPLPSPINGFLLVGSNEILHVNSLGSIKGAYVNKFFPLTTSMKLRDQSSLNLHLEGCKVEYVGDDQVLLITQDGEFLVLGFDEAGGISNFNRISKIDPKLYKGINVNNLNCITNVAAHNSALLCCNGSDSVLLHWKFNSQQKKDDKKASEDNEDSWLYDNETEKSASHRPLTNCTFTAMDTLVNVGPVADFTVGHVSTRQKVYGLPNPNYNEDAIVCTSGIDKAGGLSILNPTIKPEIKSTLKFSSASKVWTLNDSSETTKYIITTDVRMNKTQIFQVAENYKELLSDDFENKIATIQFSTIQAGAERLIVQVTATKINLFSFDFKLVKSVDYEREINTAALKGNYLIAIMKNGELDIYELDTTKKEFEKLDLPALLNYQIFTNAWITDSSILNHIKGVKPDTRGTKRDRDGNEKAEEKEEVDEVSYPVEEDSTKEVTFWIVTADNRLLVFKKNHLEKVFEFKNIHRFPETLQLSAMDPSYEADVDPIIKQAMFTTIGDKYYEKDYLVILTFGGEVLIYEIFFDQKHATYKLTKGNGMFQFPVAGAPENAYADATRVERTLFKIEDFSGYKVVMVTGSTPFTILRQHNSVPRMMKFSGTPALHFAAINASKCHHGVLATDDKKSCRMCQLDHHWDYSNRVPIRKVILGVTTNQVEYDNISGTYIASTFTEIPYKAVDEDEEPLAGTDPSFEPAKNFKGSVKLITPLNWSVIDKIDLEDNEVCNSLKVVPLRVFETLNQHKNIIIFATGKYRVEDLVANGSWKAYEVIDIVPEPGHPEANHRMKKLTEESAKGAGLGVCGISGRFGVIQGQRLLVRMLKRDGNSAPVAFTDTSLYAKDVKSFEDMMVVGDAFDGISLYGFDAEPYRVIRMGKDTHRFPLTACEFIVHEGDLFILASDEDSVMHLLEYDPYDPDSMRGLHLLRRSVFRFNGYTTAMLLKNRRESIFSMVKTLDVPQQVDLGFEVMGSNIDGSFYKVSPLNEYQYRRFYALQNYVSDKEPHWLGLNPKMNAIGNMKSIMPAVRRPFVDLNLIARYLSLNEVKKRSVSQKLGQSALVEIYKDVISLQ